AGTVGIRTVLTKTGYRCVDEPRIGRAQRLRIKAELLKTADFEVLDNDIGPLSQPADQRRALGLAEIDRGRFLAPIAAKEVGGNAAVPLAMPRRSPMTRVVAASWPFDLDYFRAEIGEQLRAPGTREHAAQIENLDTLKRPQWRRF